MLPEPEKLFNQPDIVFQPAQDIAEMENPVPDEVSDRVS